MKPTGGDIFGPRQRYLRTRTEISLSGQKRRYLPAKPYNGPTDKVHIGYNSANGSEMKEIKNVAAAENFSAISVGKLSELSDYVIELSSEVKIPGKVFGGTALQATGSEFSFQMFQPGTKTGFLHTHKNHEELYFFLAGKGEFQVDGQVFPVEEDSVVRVSPDGKRSVRNNGTTPLVMLCVQYRGDTFTVEDATDGVILNEPVKW